MDSLVERIELDAAPAVAAAAWPRFVEWVLVGPQKLACGPLACMDPVGVGLVHFEPQPSGGVTVAVQLPAIDGLREDEVQETALRQDVRHDLLLFKDYVERGRSSDPERAQRGAASLRERRRSGRRQEPDGRAGEPGVAARPGSRA